MTQRLYNEYEGTGLSPDEIRIITTDHPNLTEAQLRALLDRYTSVEEEHPKLVNEHGALAVFRSFIALAAYDPAHGGNYTIRKPVKERRYRPDFQIKKGIEEAEAELGAVEDGKVPWPLKPSADTDYESTDADGQKWDVKGFLSETPDGEKFNAEESVYDIEKDFKKGEKIIVDDRKLMLEDIQRLYRELKRQGRNNDVVWWPVDPSL